MVEFPYMYTYVHEGGPRNKKGFLPFYMVPWESNDCVEKIESRKVPLKIIHTTRASIWTLFKKNSLISKRFKVIDLV